jgi:hypothetical protein
MLVLVVVVANDVEARGKGRDVLTRLVVGGGGVGLVVQLVGVQVRF